MALVEQDITKKEQVDKNAIKLDVGNDNNGEYKMKAICNNVVYIKKSELDNILELHHLISWKRYLEEKILGSQY